MRSSLDDLTAPQRHFCGFRGDCSKFGEATLAAGKHASSIIVSCVRSCAKRHDAEHGRVPGALPLEDANLLTDDFEELSVWAARFSTDDDSTLSYFIVCHILYSPYRIIVLPLRYAQRIGDYLEFELMFRGCEMCVTGMEEFAFYTIYEFLNWNATQVKRLCIRTESMTSRYCRSLSFMHSL